MLKKHKIKKEKKQSKFRFNYWLELIFVVAVGIAITIDAIFHKQLKEVGTQSTDIVIALLPLVVTILSIILSFQKELIYGTENLEFRKLRGEKTYNFLEMMIYTVVIFVVLAVISIFDFVITVWVLDAITVTYSFIFIYQEIPILIRDEKRIKKIIRNNIHKDKKLFDIESLLSEVNMGDVLQNIVLTEGIFSAYKILKTNNKERNREYFDKLLSLQNEYLWEYIDNHSLALERTSVQYKGIDIVQAVSKVLKNIEDVIGFTDQLNIIEIYGDEEHFYHITRSMFSLHRILSELKFDDKYNKEFSKIISNIFMEIQYGETDISKNRFLHKLLNAMLIQTLSDCKLWFIKILRDSVYSDSFYIYGTTEYMVFVTTYIYYLIKLESRVPKDFKDELQKFIVSSANRTQSRGDSWVKVLQHKLNYIDIDEVTNLLPKLLSIFDCNSNELNWYLPSFRGTWSSALDRSFSKQLLINWWIGYVLTNDYLHSYSFNNEDKIILPKLSKRDSVIFAIELNKNWFVDDRLKVEVELPIAEFFGEKAKVNQYMANSPLANALNKFKNDTLKGNITKEIQEHLVTPAKLENYKKTLADGLKKAIENFPVLDKSIDVSKEAMKHFGILFDTRWSESLVKQYAEKMPEFLSRLLYEETFEKLKPIKKIITEYSSDDLQSIVDFKATSRHAYIYNYGDTDDTRSKIITEINQIPQTDKLWVPYDLFLRDKAISINFEYCEEESFVRNLNSDEINSIVDRDYKIVNGLYKYEEGANGDSTVLLSREEIIKIVTDKFFYASIVFKYKSVFKTDDILYFRKGNMK